MKRTTSTIIASLLVAVIAVGAAMPALAQDQGPAPREGIAARGDGGPGMMRHLDRHGGPGGLGGGFIALACEPDAGDRLAHMLLSVEQRTDPTGDQVALFDAFSSAATGAQADFAETCATALPAEGETAEKNLVDRLTTRLEVDQARVAAMATVLPAFEAFFTSLSDEQKAALEPRRDGEGPRMHRHRGPGPGAPSVSAPLNG